jgi:hypothetical protein
VLTVRTHLGLLVGALRAGGASGPSRRDDRAAIDVLVRGLSGPEPDARAKAHKHLKRLTGQDLPPDPEAWTRWWAENRDAFPPGGRETG